jgi:hypothetical protein
MRAGCGVADSGWASVLPGSPAFYGASYSRARVLRRGPLVLRPALVSYACKSRGTNHKIRRTLGYFRSRVDACAPRLVRRVCFPAHLVCSGQVARRFVFGFICTSHELRNGGFTIWRGPIGASRLLVHFDESSGATETFKGWAAADANQLKSIGKTARYDAVLHLQARSPSKFVGLTQSYMRLAPVRPTRDKWMTVSYGRKAFVGRVTCFCLAEGKTGAPVRGT